ncbi:hypothetical protein J7L48_01210 [bacterium]|nr:hypothetical protein [bacterium]
MLDPKLFIIPEKYKNIQQLIIIPWDLGISCRGVRIPFRTEEQKHLRKKEMRLMESEKEWREETGKDYKDYCPLELFKGFAASAAGSYFMIISILFANANFSSSVELLQTILGLKLIFDHGGTVFPPDWDTDQENIRTEVLRERSVMEKSYASLLSFIWGRTMEKKRFFPPTMKNALLKAEDNIRKRLREDGKIEINRTMLRALVKTSAFLLKSWYEIPEDLMMWHPLYQMWEWIPMLSMTDLKKYPNLDSGLVNANTETWSIMPIFLESQTLKKAKEMGLVTAFALTDNMKLKIFPIMKEEMISATGLTASLIFNLNYMLERDEELMEEMRREGNLPQKSEQGKV